MSDGITIYECTSPDEVVDLLASGQGIFGIALGRVLQEVETALAHLPSDKDRASTHPHAPVDDPKARRGKRAG